MGFIRLTCSTCKGKGSYKVSVDSLVPNTPMTCDTCNGEGSIVTHANAIGSGFTISMDPAAPSSDEVWATIWRRHEDGSLELIESGKVPSLKEDQAEHITKAIQKMPVDQNTLIKGNKGPLHRE